MILHHQVVKILNFSEWKGEVQNEFIEANDRYLWALDLHSPEKREKGLCTHDRL